MRTPISPSFMTAINLMNMISRQVEKAEVDPLGLKVLRQPTMWLAADRSTVRNTFDNMLFQSLDMLGLPRFTLPVGICCCCYCVFCSPC